MSISMFKSTAKLAGTMRNSVKSFGDEVGQSTGLDVLKKKKMHDNLPSIGGELSGWVHLEQAGHLVKHGGMEKQWLQVQGGTISWTTEKGRAKDEEPYAVGKLTGCTVSIPKSKRRGWPHCVRIDLKKADSMFVFFLFILFGVMALFTVCNLLARNEKSLRKRSREHPRF